MTDAALRRLDACLRPNSRGASQTVSLYLFMLVYFRCDLAVQLLCADICVALRRSQVLHGLVGGMLFVIALPALYLTFAATRIRALVTVLVPSLFGAATLGPLAAALLQHPAAWRMLFGIEIAVALIALWLAWNTVAQKPAPQTSDEPVYWAALVISSLGSTSIFYGVFQLAQHDWTYPSAFVSVALGVGAFLAMFVWEALQPRPLVPVRALLASIAVVGALSTIAGSAVYGATQTTMTLQLERLMGFGVAAAGGAFWPAALAAFFAGGCTDAS